MQQDDYCLESVSTFDKFAERYADQYFHLHLYDQYLERFASQIESRSARVLDLACGPGNVSAYLAKKRPDLEIIGIDLSPAMVEQARRRVPSAEFLVRDCRDLGGSGGVFDAASFSFGLSYLTDADAKRVFTSLNAALSTITGESGRSGFETSGTGERIYIEYRSASDVVSMVERAGYRIDFTEVVESPANAPKATEDLILIAQREHQSPV